MTSPPIRMALRMRDLDFLLYEVLDTQALCRSPRYQHHARETFDQVLSAAETLAHDLFHPHAAESDTHEPHLRDSQVLIVPQVKEALTSFSETGFLAMGFDTEAGGLQMPWVIVQACYAHFYQANVSTTAYAMLTAAAANVLATFGTEEQKARYLHPMLRGRFFGTMCLSEPAVGSSLADLRTRADPQPDGTYRLKGSKMWISGGEHDLSENIIHMVLARVAGAPPGTAGLSLFLVPRRLVAGDGQLQERNDITLAGLNHKMGYRGTVNTLLNFGERGGCIGYLIGEENRGLHYMFHMMNEARIAVGLGATMLARAAYVHSLEYARQRTQGRLPDTKAAASAPVRIIEHADIKRLLLAQKASVEGSLALCLFCARLVDELRVTTGTEQARLSLLLDVLTPIAKSWPSEFCLEANKHAIQVLGGHGYTRDHPVERLYRDNRLNAIHEGTHGIQGIDLLGRKVTLADGAGLLQLMSRIREAAQAAEVFPALRNHSEALRSACVKAEAVTRALVDCSRGGRRNLALANATLYLDMMGHIVIAWMWLWQARVAAGALERAGEVDRAFYAGKINACRYFYRYELPKVDAQADLLMQLDDTCLTMPAEAF
jgi:alkylation response protein AidB-like acyl-CoA dehydrogenase